ncbi:hypothetical protein GN958_ATG02640 [Phytophthora infestans]|uniref:Uncharacterized protein n=1 Tax=Phytophthora infestans TaxID=4787 RepID=A0A8S9V7R5_PHYIN|nr:hypothetical protein GN958_ATG02640 [Phytophthora infestans]
MKGEQIRLLVRAKQDSQSHAPQPTPMEEDEFGTGNDAVTVNRSNWSQLWQQLGTTWPSSAKSEFPLATGSTTQWAAAAKGEPAKLVRLLQRLPYPDELLTAVAEPALQ